MANNIEILRQELNNINVDDDMISRGVNLTDNGKEKLARHFNCSLVDIDDMINELVMKLKNERKPDPIQERFSYGADFMGNVILYDSVSGKEKSLEGYDAITFMKELNFLGEQDCIKEHFDITESDGMFDELSGTRSGTYNFPYKKYFGTARYSMKNGDFNLDIISLRDNEGEEVDIDNFDIVDINNVAMKYIEEA